MVGQREGRSDTIDPFLIKAGSISGDGSVTQEATWLDWSRA